VLKKFLVAVKCTKFYENPSGGVSELFRGDGWKSHVTRLTAAYRNRLAKVTQERIEVMSLTR
jgi:hypothetical protein